MTTEQAISKIAKVIEVIDASTVVVNAGKMHGVKTGMRCRIVAPTRNAVDPDTGESLGEYNLHKGYGMVDDVYEKFSIVRGHDYTLSSMLSSIHSFGRGQHCQFDNAIDVHDLVSFY